MTNHAAQRLAAAGVLIAREVPCFPATRNNMAVHHLKPSYDIFVPMQIDGQKLRRASGKSIARDGAQILKTGVKALDARSSARGLC